MSGGGPSAAWIEVRGATGTLAASLLRAKHPLPGARPMKCLFAILLDTVRGFFADEALVRGASIASFTLFSRAPILVIAVAVAGMVPGDEAATGGIQARLQGLLGTGTAEAVETMVPKASVEGGAGLAGAISFGLLLLAASGTFGALQSAPNAVWQAATPDAGISGLVRAKPAAISAFGGWPAR